jgi:hypothetical protein
MLCNLFGDISVSSVIEVRICLWEYVAQAPRYEKHVVCYN